MSRNPGSYILIIRVSRSVLINVGRLGSFNFPRGFYAYCGSAKRGIQARVQRHLGKNGKKKLHWHIDYLLASPEASIVEVRSYPHPGPSEHDLVHALLRQPGNKLGPAGFGSSDCRRDCGTHLVDCGRTRNNSIPVF